jgi:nitrite reductase/ring-hydroxylating ferredoxin subunit
VDPITSFFYWNMQYHTEHHMFPGVPFHALHRLHDKIKDQLPPTYPSVWAAYREIIPVILRQQREYNAHITPQIPEEYPTPAVTPKEEVVREKSATQSAEPGVDVTVDQVASWVPVPDAEDLPVDDVLLFVHEKTRYAIYRLADGYYATLARCSHAGALLTKGLVIDEQIECPAHQGRFDIRTGEATHSPACTKMATFPVRVVNNEVQLGLPEQDG